MLCAGDRCGRRAEGWIFSGNLLTAACDQHLRKNMEFKIKAIRRPGPRVVQGALKEIET